MFYSSFIKKVECQSLFRKPLFPFPIVHEDRQMEDLMKYRVHKLEVSSETAQGKLQAFLNDLEGEILAVVPNVSPVFRGMGATAKVDFLLIIEKTG